MKFRKKYWNLTHLMPANFLKESAQLITRVTIVKLLINVQGTYLLTDSRVSSITKTIISRRKKDRKTNVIKQKSPPKTMQLR